MTDAATRRVRESVTLRAKPMEPGVEQRGWFARPRIDALGGELL